MKNNLKLGGALALLGGSSLLGLSRANHAITILDKLLMAIASIMCIIGIFIVIYNNKEKRMSYIIIIGMALILLLVGFLW